MSIPNNNNSTISIIDVPTEAGTHFPGQALAPAALREAGLAQKLEGAGFKVLQSSALASPQRWKPNSLVNGVKDEQSTLKVMSEVQRTLASDSTTGTIPLVLGGDCSITPAVLSGLYKSHPSKKMGVIYFDGDADLTLPLKPGEDPTNFTGILDSMVLSHLTQRTGSLESMKAFSKPNQTPLVNNQNIVLFGFQPEELKTEHWTYLLENGFKAYTRPTVSRDPVKMATEALTWLEERVDGVTVHFDVDVIDSGVFPLANYPHYCGLGFEEAMGALGVFVKSEKLVGMCVTEVNPNNDPDGFMVGKLVDGVVKAFEGRMGE